MSPFVLRPPALAAGVALAAVLTATPAADAATRYVAPCGNDTWAGVGISCVAPVGPLRTIQAAIDASSHGDEIILLPGIHDGGFDTDGKAITIRGLGGADTTIISGGGFGRLVTINSLEGPGTRFEDLSFQGGWDDDGGAVLIALASPVFERCVFATNLANDDGGAVYAIASSPTFIDCDFDDNNAFDDGGAIHAENGGTITIEGGRFLLNDADSLGGGISAVGTTVVIDGTIFDRNEAVWGGGISAQDTDITMEWASFEDNFASYSGAGVHAQFGTLSLDHTSFTENEALHRGGAIASIDANLFLDWCNTSSNFVPGAGGLSGGGAIFVDGGTMQMFRHNAHSNSAPRGGAILARDAVVDIWQLTTSNCAAVDGGNLWLEGATVNLTDSTVSYGNALGDGGSIHAKGGGLFIGNTTVGHSLAAGQGGGLFLMNVEVVLDDIGLWHNESAGEGGGAWIWVDEALPYETVIRDSHIDSNLALNHGGGLHVRADHLEITDSWIRFNRGDEGGGVFADAHQHDQPLLIANCEVRENESTRWGGGMSLRGGYDFVIRGGAFLGNVAGLGGGGVYAYCNDGWIDGTQFGGNDGFAGGAIRASAADLHVSNVIGTNNSAVSTGGFARTDDFGSIRFQNATILLNDAPAGSAFSTSDISQIVVENSIVDGHGDMPHAGEGFFIARYSLVPESIAGPGCIHGNPGFVNLAGGDLRLAPGSPAIDAGLNWLLPDDATDLDADGDLTEFLPLDRDGNPRVMDGGAGGGCGVARVDMGAYEAMGAAVPIPPMADLDGNGVVDFNDLLALLAAWGNVEACALADLDGDGDVDFEDLLIVLAHWDA